MRRNEVRAVRELEPGTLVRLPEEMGRQVGYAEGGGSTRVLLPGHNRLDACDMPEAALIEVVAAPRELAHAYLRGGLGRVDRRWKRRERRGPAPSGPAEKRDPGEISPESGEAA